jgi:hypothetical protein
LLRGAFQDQIEGRTQFYVQIFAVEKVVLIQVLKQHPLVVGNCLFRPAVPTKESWAISMPMVWFAYASGTNTVRRVSVNRRPFEGAV